MNGCSSEAERNLTKVEATGSNPVTCPNSHPDHPEHREGARDDMKSIEPSEHSHSADSREGASEPVDKVVTLRVPSTLLEHIERCCARRGIPMPKALQQILEREFPLPTAAS